MRHAYTALALLIAAFATLIFTGAKSAIHEIEAFMLYLIASVFLMGGAIIGEIRGLSKAKQPKDAPPAPFVPPNIDNDADELLANAKRYIRDGDRSKAVVTLQRLVESYPGTAAAAAATKALAKASTT
jgi:hypothetical protein